MVIARICSCNSGIPTIHGHKKTARFAPRGCRGGFPFPDQDFPDQNFPDQIFI
jgi:hypothetical protein